jgi:DNA-binding Xre family transcriptional regulator
MEKIFKNKSRISVSEFLGLDENDPDDQNFLRFQHHLGGLLRVMIKKRISQAQLAKRMGISRQAVSDKFSGKNTSIEWIERACDALGVELRMTFVDKKKAA